MARDERTPVPSRLQGAQRQDLVAGPLRVQFDPTGELRHLQVAGSEVLSRIYFAVRDDCWGTVPGELSDCQVVVSNRGFRVSFQVRHESGNIQFRWRGEIIGDVDRISFVAEGQADSEFLYNRVGLCVLYPSDAYAGRTYRVRGAGGDERTGEFPVQIEPQRFDTGHLVAAIEDVCRLSVDLPSASLECEFIGDIFEIEDQRNWTDNSYKVYSTPIHLPYPKTASRGEKFRQEVGIWIRAQDGSLHAVKADAVRLDIETPLQREVASVGFGLQQMSCGLDAAEGRALKALQPHHLRYEARCWEDGWSERLKAFLRTCRALSCEAEVSVYLTQHEQRQVAELAGVLRLVELRTRLGIFHLDEEVTDPQWLDLVRREMRHLASVVSVGGGTDLHFCEINRHREFAEASGSVYYSITPQVHASDEESIVETLEAQRETVCSARAIVGDAKIGIAPVTLHQRAPAKRRMAGVDTADAADPRQKSLFLAAWTVGSLYYLQDSGASTLTYFEVIGPGGPMDGFGASYPVYHVFANYADLRSGEMLTVASSDRRQAVGVAAVVGGSKHALVANLTAESRTVEIGPFSGRCLRAHVLEDEPGQEALRDLGEFRCRQTLLSTGDDERIAIVLGPYACAYVKEDP